MNPGYSLQEVKRELKRRDRVFIAVPFLAELLNPSFSENPIYQWGKVLLTRALDDLKKGKKTLLVHIFFKDISPR